MYEQLESKFFVTYPESNNATYKSVMNYSDDLETKFQRWYRYKEGYSIGLVKKLIIDYCNDTNGIILDPFVGSGSTILGAKELNMRSIGFEVNPFSYFLAKTKLDNYYDLDIKKFEDAYNNIINISKINTRSYSLPKLSISNKVFGEEVEAYFMTIKLYIEEYEKKNIKIYNLLKLGWLACLEDVSSYRKAGNGLKMRKYVKPRILTIDDVYKKLLNQYENMKEDIINDNSGSNVRLYNESCLKMKEFINANEISGIIFSPPYANCFDYTEIYKLELWFGEFVKDYSDLKKLRAKSLRSHLNGKFETDSLLEVNSESLEVIIGELETKKLWDKRIPYMLRSYFSEMYEVMESCYEVLQKNGFCAIIVGNSAYGGVIVPTDLILAEYAEKIGFRVDKIEVDRYIITSAQQYESTKENKRFLRESVICLVKEK